MYLVPHWGWPMEISPRSLASENYSPWAIVHIVQLMIHLAALTEHTLVTDAHTVVLVQHKVKAELMCAYTMQAY